jgi:hypothetical protein
MMLIRPSFGYSKVQLMNGQQGYVASQDIRAAPPQLVSAKTTPMVPTSHETGRTKFHFDPRSIPPEPLPNDAPEPTPIPETEASPSP